MADPRDIYKNDIDFTTLALQYPDFAKKLKPNKQLDFSDPESVRELTKCLLHRDFKITIDLPDDRLCPPVPNRYNYILWLQDLVDTTSDNFRDEYDPNREVVGLDIGTGASCIYPLLACRARPNWKLVGTEIDPKSFSYAYRNVRTNDHEFRIQVLQTGPDPEGPLIPPVLLENVERIDFTMMNPPFYASEADLLASAAQKKRPPNSACTGAPVEMIYAPGGEVAFIKRLIAESTQPVARERVQWFSSMVGKFASVGAVVEELRGKGCGNWAVGELVNGKVEDKGKKTNTRRWVVAWSWKGRRPRMDVARGIGGLEKKWLPFPSVFVFEVEVNGGGVGGIAEKIDREIKALDGMKWQWKAHMAQGLGMAEQDVWSRKARRRRQEQGEGSAADEMDEDDDEKEAALVFKISLGQDQGGKVAVNVRWLQGKETVLFESFCGWLKRRVEGR